MESPDSVPRNDGSGRSDSVVIRIAQGCPLLAVQIAIKVLQISAKRGADGEPPIGLRTSERRVGAVRFSGHKDSTGLPASGRADCHKSPANQRKAWSGRRASDRTPYLGTTGRGGPIQWS